MFKVINRLYYRPKSNTPSICNSCHFNGGNPTELDEVIIDSPSNGGLDWDYDWGFNGDPVIPSVITNPSNPSAENLGPDCTSFKFQNASSLWQEAAVTNIKFKVYLVNNEGVNLLHLIQYPQAMSFGMPRNLTIGGTNITPGVAASIAAIAVRDAIKQTVQMYGNKPVSEMTVSNYFLTRLESNFENMVPGARFQKNYYSNGIIPSNYETNILGIGDCN